MIKKNNRLKLYEIVALIIITFILLVSCAKSETDFDFSILTDEEINAIADAKNSDLLIGVYTGDDESEFIINNIMTEFELTYQSSYYDNFSVLLNDVTNGNVDFVVGITQTDQRSLILDYSAPVSPEDIYIYSYHYDIITNLENKVIAIQNGTIYIDLVSEYFPQAQIITYDTTEEGFDLLANDLADGLISMNIIYEEAIRRGLNSYELNSLISVKPVSIVSKKGLNSELISAMSKYVIHSNFRNELIEYKEARMLAITQDVIAQLVDEYFLPTDRRLEIKFENNPPHVIFGKNDDLTGVFPEIADDICNILGFECEVMNSQSETWGQMYSDLIEGQIDVLSPVTKTPEREETLIFSSAIYRNKYSMVKRENYETSYTLIHQLVFEKIGLVTDDVKAIYIEELFPYKEFKYYNSNQEMIEGLSNQEVDYIMLNNQTYYDYVYTNNNFELVIDDKLSPVFEYEICFAFPNNDRGEHLSHLFNVAINLVDVNKIVDNYSYDSSFLDYADRIYKSNILLASVFTALLISLLGILYLNINNSRKRYNMSTHDYMTGLLNRRGFIIELDKWGSSKSIVVIYLDLDNFKHYNDLKGHQTGDKILIELANKLKLLENTDTIVSRFGGDEYIIGYHTDNIESVKILTEKIQAIFDQDISLELFKCYLTASVGVSIYPQDGENIKEVIEKAEIAMQKAKDSYSNKIIHYNNDLKNTIQKTSEIVEQIKQCIANDDFEMVYQPQVSLKNEQIVAVEALLRMKGSNMSPGIFVPIAEKNGLMNQIGRIVIKLVVEQMSDWKKSGYELLPVSINLSPTQLHDTSIVKYIEETLKTNEIPVELIIIEITEDVFIDKEGLVINTLKELKKLGISTAIDDFGSGNAGVNYLTNFEVDFVKIDKSVADKYLNIENLEIYKTIENLCKTLNFSVVAEGIETLEQITYLKKLNISFVQGFYYYKPMSAKKIEAKLCKKIV